MLRFLTNNLLLMVVVSAIAAGQQTTQRDAAILTAPFPAISAMRLARDAQYMGSHHVVYRAGTRGRRQRMLS